MRTSGLQSILLPVPEAEPVVAPSRRDGDWSSRRGVPAHLTIAGPWPLAVELPMRALADTRDAMRGARYTLGSVGTLGNAICLFAEDDAPLLRWRRRILEVVGSKDQIDERWRLHMTVCRGLPSVAAQEVKASIVRALPIACTIDTVLLARLQDDSLTLRSL